MAEKAISFDDELEEAYVVRSSYYQEIGEIEMAFTDIDKAIKLNPNSVMAIRQKGQMYCLELHDFTVGIPLLNKAARLEHGIFLPELLRDIGNAYGDVGFFDQEREYFNQAMKLDNDSVRYFEFITYREKDPAKAIEFAKKCIDIDENDIRCAECMAWAYSKIEDYEKAAEYYLKYISLSLSSGYFDMTNSHRIGYAFTKIGEEDAAEAYFDEQIRYCEESIENNRGYARWYGFAYYDLAGIYAYLGNKAQAYRYLRGLSGSGFYPERLVNLIKRDELFESIRDEQEFQRIVRDMEAKYLMKRAKVKDWLLNE